MSKLFLSILISALSGSIVIGQDGSIVDFPISGIWQADSINRGDGWEPTDPNDDLMYMTNTHMFMLGYSEERSSYEVGLDIPYHVSTDSMINMQVGNEDPRPVFKIFLTEPDRMELCEIGRQGDCRLEAHLSRSKIELPNVEDYIVAISVEFDNRITAGSWVVDSMYLPGMIKDESVLDEENIAFKFYEDSLLLLSSTDMKDWEVYDGRWINHVTDSTDRIQGAYFRPHMTAEVLSEYQLKVVWYFQGQVFMTYYASRSKDIKEKRITRMEMYEPLIIDE